MSPLLTVQGLAGGGMGVAHLEDQVWFVRGALPGETVEADAVRSRARVREAEVRRLAGPPHPARESDPCPHAPRCGGCDWPHVRPEDGARLKASVAAGAARGHPELSQILKGAPVRSSPLNYRLRARLHWDAEAGRLGFYRRRSWEVTGIQGCRLLSPRLQCSLQGLEEALRYAVPGTVDVEWLEDLAGASAVAALRPARGGPREIPEGWLPPAAKSQGLVDGWHVLSPSGRRRVGWGAEGVTMELPVPLHVPIGAFFQVNRHLVPWLFQRVAALARPGDRPVWDLHGGVGLLAAAAATAGTGPVTLVEPFRPAARAAAANIPAARVVVGRTAEAYLARHRRLTPEAVVLTDPPRSGMTAKLRHQITGWHPRRLVMMSCDPATWARDAAGFLARGYRLEHVELVDLFPGTSHVEVLAVLESG